MATRVIRSILLPLDGSKGSAAALDMAVSLARSCHAEITAIYAVSPPSRTEFATVHSVRSKTNKQEVRKASKMLADAANAAARKGISLGGKIAYGDAGYCIVKEAHSRRKYDIIVLASRGHGRVREAFFGSVSNYVLHASKVPVLLVK